MESKGFIKIIVGIDEPISEDDFYEMRLDFETAIRASLDIDYDVDYFLKCEVHQGE